ncbi:hypothetical protein ES707_20260 [subsurface metagenome]
MTNLVPGTKLYIYDKFGAWHQICHLVFSALLTSPARNYMLCTLHYPLFFSIFSFSFLTRYPILYTRYFIFMDLPKVGYILYNLKD